MIYAIQRAIICFLLAIVTSTLMIRLGLRRLKTSAETGVGTRPFPSSGFWIGFFETVLVFVFVIEHEYSALAIIIAAKEFVRKEKIAEDPVYYLLGTLCNISIAILFALLARIWMSGFLGIFLV